MSRGSVSGGSEGCVHTEALPHGPRGTPPRPRGTPLAGARGTPPDPEAHTSTVNRMTNRCKDITFQQLRLRAVITTPSPTPWKSWIRTEFDYSSLNFECPHHPLSVPTIQIARTELELSPPHPQNFGAKTQNQPLR